MALKRPIIEGLVTFAILFLSFRLLSAALLDPFLAFFHGRQTAEAATVLELIWTKGRWVLMFAGWAWIGYKLTTREWEQVRWALLMTFMAVMSFIDAASRERRAAMDAEVRVRFEEDHSGTFLLLLFLAALAGSGSNAVG